MLLAKRFLSGLFLAFLSCLAISAENGPATPKLKRIDLEVRVVEPSGKPIANAAVRFWKRPETKPWEWPIRYDTVLIAGQKEIRTGDDGKAIFSISAPNMNATDWKPPSRFAITASAENHLEGRSGPIESSESDRFELTFTLRRLMDIEGRVIDQQGRPVADATVFHTGNALPRMEVNTDAQGRFRLGGLPEGKTPVFVRHPDYHFFGQLVDTSSISPEFKLLGKEQTPAPLAALPQLLSREEELKLARQVIVPLWEADMNSKDDSNKEWHSEWFAELDPWFVYGEVEKRLNNNEKNSFVYKTFPLLYSADPEEALAVLESSDLLKSTKTDALIHAAKESSGISRKQKLDLLDRAIMCARVVPEPNDRIDNLSSIAVAFFDLGKVDEAKRIVDELQPLALKLSPEKNAGICAAVGQAISLFDLPTGVRFVQNDPYEPSRVRALFHIAKRIAAINPAEAERIVADTLDKEITRSEKEFQDEYKRDLPESMKQSIICFDETRVAPICYYMATVDTDRAERMALKVRNPYQRAYCIGMIAKALASKDKDKAKKLILQSYDILGEASANPRPYWILITYSSPLRVAGALLGVVEEIDPTLLKECIWQSVSFRQYRPADDYLISMKLEADDARLAIFLARYDRKLASAIFPDANKIIPSPKDEDWRSLEALALIDPERLFSALGDDLTVHIGDRRTIVEILSLEPSRRWDRIADHYWLWTPHCERFMSSFPW